MTVARGDVRLFVTCLVDLVRPEAGEAAVRLLRRAGYHVVYPREQTCCGQPAFNTGYPDEARRVAATTLRALADGDGPIVGLSGSCVATVQHVWPELFASDVRLNGLARDVAARTRELGAFLAPLVTAAPPVATGRPTVAVHCSCHQRRELHDTTSGAALVDALGTVERVPYADEDICCGFGGTFSIAFDDVSGAMGRAKVRAALAGGATQLVSADAGCLMHVDGCAKAAGLPLETMSLAELLDREGLAFS